MIDKITLPFDFASAKLFHSIFVLREQSLNLQDDVFSHSLAKETVTNGSEFKPLRHVKCRLREATVTDLPL